MIYYLNKWAVTYNILIKKRQIYANIKATNLFQNTALQIFLQIFVCEMFIHFGYNLHFWLFSGVGIFFWIFKGIVVSNKQLADGTVLSNIICYIIKPDKCIN